MERGIIFRGLIKEAFALLVLYLGYSYFWGAESWSVDKAKELLFFLCIGIIHFLLSYFSILFSKPVTITLTQSNMFNQDVTNYSIKGPIKSQEHERTVSLVVSIKRKQSIWGMLYLKLLHTYDLVLLFEPSSPGIIIEADRAPLRTDLDETSKGFKILIDSYLSNIITNTTHGVYSKGCHYVISEDITNIVSDETFIITPRILQRNGREIPRFVTFLLSFDRSKCGHVVNFKWE